MTRRGGEAHAIGQVQDQLPSARASPCRLSTCSQGYRPLLRGTASGNLHAHHQECSWHTSRSAAWPDCAGQPVVCADPCNGPAGGQIEYVCAAAECIDPRSEEHTSELQSHLNLVCRLLLEKKKHTNLLVTTKY